MRSLIFAGALCALVACGDDGPVVKPDASLGPPWWTPHPGEAANWDIQLHEPIDISPARDMYVLDLFAVVKAPTMLDYGDGAPITVPAGAHATAIDTIHARGAKVVCRVSISTVRLSDPDASKFPGSAAPVDSPTPIPANTVVGYKTGSVEDPDERWLDVRPGAARTTVSKLIGKRFDLAVQMGCDAIDADRISQADHINSDFGWPIITPTEQQDWDIAVADLAHADGRQISIGHRDGFNFITEPAEVEAYDFAIVSDMSYSDICATDGCEPIRPLQNAGKASWDFENLANIGTGPDQITKDVACARFQRAGYTNGIFKDAAFTKTRDACGT